RALGLESYLPAVKAAAVVEGERYDSASHWAGRTQEAATGPGTSRGEWASAGDSPAEFTYRVRLSEPRLMTLQARVSGDGPRIRALDGRMRANVDASAMLTRFAWRHVLTAPLASGEHVIRALVPAGASIDRIRLVALQADDPDYVEVLEQMGFPQGSV